MVWGTSCHKEKGTFRKAEMTGMAVFDEKDFPNMTEVCKQEGHYSCVKRTNDCPGDKKMNWSEFLGWTNAEASSHEGNDSPRQDLDNEAETQREAKIAHRKRGGKALSNWKVKDRKC